MTTEDHSTTPTGDREPAYLKLDRSGLLRARADEARGSLRSCRVCPRTCGVDRLADERGRCGTGARARVASAGPHFGEEAPLVGRGGSGTIFFAGCNLACVFCQNHDISHPGPAAEAVLREVDADGLARLMLELQEAGCVNINFVSPSHVVPQIVEALPVAVEAGLVLPLVYNTGGYDSLETLRLLDGVVDIYMPDVKYADEGVGMRLSDVTDYVARNRVAVLEMHRQVGDLVLDELGVARRGLLVRHLVLPGGLAGTPEVATFLADRVSRATYVNVMDQYRPEYEVRRRPGDYPDLARALTAREHHVAVEQMRQAGISRLDGLEGRWFAL